MKALSDEQLPALLNLVRFWSSMIVAQAAQLMNCAISLKERFAAIVESQQQTATTGQIDHIQSDIYCHRVEAAIQRLLIGTHSTLI